MYYVYILYSKTKDGYYCGQTSNMASRILRHNAGETQSIKYGRPWVVLGIVRFETRSEAMLMERLIKKRGIKRWLVSNHTILEEWQN